MNSGAFTFIGGYPVYVWISYALTILAVSVEVWLLVRRQSRRREHLLSTRPVNDARGAR
jgi:heme exporter protein CcmD